MHCGKCEPSLSSSLSSFPAGAGLEGSGWGDELRADVDGMNVWGRRTAAWVESCLRDYLAIQQMRLLRQLERLHVSVGLVRQAHGMRFEAWRSSAWVFEGQVHELSWGHKCLGHVQIAVLS